MTARKPKKIAAPTSMIAGLRAAGVAVAPIRIVKKIDVVPALLLRKKAKR